MAWLNIKGKKRVRVVNKTKEDWRILIFFLQFLKRKICILSECAIINRKFLKKKIFWTIWNEHDHKSKFRSIWICKEWEMLYKNCWCLNDRTKPLFFCVKGRMYFDIFQFFTPYCRLRFLTCAIVIRIEGIPTNRHFVYHQGKKRKKTCQIEQLIELK